MGSAQWRAVVARAWTDPAFRQRLLANGKAAVGELGLRCRRTIGTWSCWRTRRTSTT